MSTVKATHFEHPSASTAGITLAADGSVVLPQGFTGGIGSNVVSAATTTTTTSTSTSFSGVSLSASITPTSASSKILVLVSLTAGTHGDSGKQIAGLIRIRRDGTTTVGNNRRIQQYENLSGAGGMTQTVQFIAGLDSPATTSSVSYAVEIAVTATNNGNTIRVNFDTSESNIFLIEVAE